ncbi:MAG: hypothetical protein NW220_00875 [Leptolyngbyaceae cyanobacterium bins.349]|nr:hypothetical protein [Leptolyngbyaceae cyanobacterium bins.349]
MNRLNSGFALLIALMAIGCVPQALLDKQAELCTKLANVENSLQQVKDIENNPNLSTLKQAEAQLSEAFRQVKATVEAVPAAETETSVEHLQSSYEDLKASVQQTADQQTASQQTIPQQTTDPSKIAQATTKIRDRATKLHVTLTQIKQRLRCPAAQ